MTRKEKTNELGILGERVFRDFVIDKWKVKVDHDFDKFDDTKDMVIWGKRFEVKTQVPFFFKNGFAAKESQLKKISNVSRVIFISVPPPKNTGWARQNYHLAGNIYSLNIEKKDYVYHSHTTKDGRRMIVFPIDQEHMTLIHKIDDPIILAKMQELSVSDA
jgi:hypothetical protein